MRFIRFLRHLRQKLIKEKFKTLVWYDLNIGSQGIKTIYMYINNLYESTQVKSLNEYIYWIGWFHPTIKWHNKYMFLQGWGSVFSRVPVSAAICYIAYHILIWFSGGSSIFNYIIYGIFFYALIWREIQYWRGFYTPSGRRSVLLYKAKRMKKVQKYLMLHALNKNRSIVMYKDQIFLKETSLKSVRQRWTLGKTKFQSYMFDNNRRCKHLFEFFDANRYIIKHHISYYRHDVVLDPLARTLENQKAFKDYILKNKMLNLITAEFKAKGYICGNGNLEIKKLYVKDYVYNHKNNSRNILACYALCWVSTKPEFCIPILSLGPWAVEKEERKPWYVIIDSVVSKEAFKRGYRLQYIFDSMRIKKRRIGLPSYDIIYGTPPRIFERKKRKSASRQMVVEARKRYNLPERVWERKYWKYWYMIETSRFANPRANFKDIYNTKFAKKWDRKNPRLGRIFQWLEAEKGGRWYYWKLFWVRKKLVCLKMWRGFVLYPFIIWCIVVFVASIFYCLDKIRTKFLPLICNELLKFIKRTLKNIKMLLQIMKWNFYNLAKPKKVYMQSNGKDCDLDIYLFGKTETGMSWYRIHEMKLNKLRRLIKEKLWFEKESDEHMLELRHKIIVGESERFIKPNWYLLYDYEAVHTIRSMVKRPWENQDRYSNLWQVSDILKYRLVAEQCFESIIYREDLSDTLLYLCANMDTYLPQIDQKAYIMDMLDFFCIFPTAVTFKTLPLKNATEIEWKVKSNNYIVGHDYEFLNKLKDNLTLFSRINQTYIKEDLIFHLSEQIVQAKPIKSKRRIMKWNIKTSKIKNKNVILKKFNKMSWDELNLYL